MPLGHEAIAAKGWLSAHKYLLLRRASQVFFLVLFLLGPWFGIWIVQGTLAGSLTLGVLPLTDPFVFLQSLIAGHWPELTAAIGAVIVSGVLCLARRSRLLFLGLPHQPGDRHRALVAP